MTRDTSSDNPAPFDRRLLLIIAGLAAGLRIWIVGNVHVIARDGLSYIDAAKHYAAGDFLSGMSHYYPPGYPISIALASSVAPSWEAAAQAISFLFGVLLIIPVGLLGREFAGNRGGVLAALLVAVHPELIRYSGEATSESTYLFFLATFLYFGVRAILSLERSNGRPTRWALAAGVLAVFAYFIRPEGLGLALIGAAWMAFVVRGPAVKQRLQVAALVLLPCIVCIPPYVLFLKDRPILGESRFEGEWKISGKRSLADMLGRGEIWQEGKTEVSSAGTQSFLSRVASNVIKLLLKLIEIGHPLFLALALVGLWFRPTLPRRWPAEGWILVIAGAYLCLFALVRVDRRFVLQFVPMLVPLAAVGWVELENKLLGRFAARGGWVLAGCAVLLAGSTLPVALRPKRVEKTHLVAAGKWLGSQDPRPERILSTRRRVAFYAGVDQVPFPAPNDLEELSGFMAREKIFYLVVDDESQIIPDSGQFEVIRVFVPPIRGRESTVRIYQRIIGF